MKNHDFNTLYTRVFEDPLLALGFARVGRGKSLKHLEDGRDLRILRLRGRFARPGTIRTVIVFRHSVLRPVRSDDPGLETLDVSDFPRKLTFYDFSGDSWRHQPYRPKNRGRYGYDTLEFAAAPAREVEDRLRTLREIAETRILPWSRGLTPERELEEIARNGENAWCERRWIEDYRAALTPPAP